MKFIIRLLNKFHLLKFININGSIKVNGKSITIPVLGGLGIENLFKYETWLTQILIKLKPLFKEDFLDVGVNIGQTLIKAYTVFDKVNYIGFEPNSVCVNYVQNLVAVNKFKNCTLIPAGISDKTEMLKLNFYYDHVNDSTASIIEQFRPEQSIDHSLLVPVFNFSTLTNVLNTSTNGLLKIDVEGAELEVIQGLKEWIDKSQPIILIEVLPVYTKENLFRIKRQQQMENILSSLNYKISRINKTTIQLNELEEIGIHENLDDSDYVLYPASLRESIHKLFQ